MTLTFSLRRIFSLLGFTILLLATASCSDQGQVVDTRPARLKLAASIYVGWMPWMFAAEQGYLKAAGERNGVEIDLVRGDYVETINQFINGHVDAVVMTNIDALGALAESKMAADVILIGSFSKGNDAILVRSVGDELRGGTIGLVKNSVSEYLLNRYLESQNIAADQVNVVDVSDVDMAKTFSLAGENMRGVVTWNPIASAIRTNADAHLLADSAKFEREIADCLIVRRSVLQSHPEFARALLQAWFQVMADLEGGKRTATINRLAELSGSSTQDYIDQLGSTELIDNRDKAIAAFNDSELNSRMQRVSRFVAQQGLAKTDQDGWFSVGEQSTGVLRFNPEPVRNAQ